MRDQLNKGNNLLTPLNSKRKSIFQGGERKSMKMRKFMASLLVFAMLLAILPMGAVSAAATYSAVSVENIKSTAASVKLGAIKFVLDPMQTTSSALVSFPTNFEVLTVIALPGSKNVTAAGITVSAVTLSTVSSSVAVGTDDELKKNEAKIEIAADPAVVALGEKVEFYLQFSGKTTGVTGEVVANIKRLAGEFADGAVVVATAGQGAVEVSVGDPINLSSKGLVTFTVTENMAAALKAESNSLRFSLPSGFKWTDAVTVSALVGDASKLGAGAPTLAAGTNYSLLNSDRTIALTPAGVSAQKSIYRITAQLETTSTSNFGDIKVTIGGETSSSVSELLVAKYNDFGLEAAVKSTKELVSGTEAKTGELVFSEKAAGSLVEGRTIYLKLPAGVKWKNTTGVTSPNLTVTPGLENNDGTMKITVNTSSVAAGKAGSIKLKDVEVRTKIGFTGDIAVEVSGNAGLSGTYVIATVNSPVSITAEQAEMVVGVQDQVSGKITIKENKAGALKTNGKITLTFATGSQGTIVNKPTVKVVEGDADITSSLAGSTVTLTVKADSTVASTIELTGMKYTLDRAVPEGAFSIEVSDDNTNVALRDAATVTAFANAGDNLITKVSNATVITPATDKGVVGEVKFVIDAKTFTVNGKEKSMDVAPYIQDGRTMLPVRFVAEALGVSEDNIIWDATTKTVTIMKGDRIAQMVIGSKVMVVNGVNVNMDTAAALKDGRTVLPLRFAAQALGANIEWDDATRTVTIN